VYRAIVYKMADALASATAWRKSIARDGYPREEKGGRRGWAPGDGFTNDGALPFLRRRFAEEN
jgi:hypothetical protein